MRRSGCTLPAGIQRSPKFEIQILERYGRGKRLPQGFEGNTCLAVVGMRLQIFLDVFGLGHDVAGNETVGNLVVLREDCKISVHAVPPTSQIAICRSGTHVRHVHVAVLVERGGERLVHVIGMGGSR